MGQIREWDPEPYWEDPNPPSPQAWESDPREIVGILYGPDGDPLSLLLDRPYVPFGFGVGPRQPEWWVRS